MLDFAPVRFNSPAYLRWGKKHIDRKPRANNEIRAKELRVVDADGENRGVMTKEDALALAKEQGLDLVVVTDKANPPVARIIDYGKYIYQLQKKERRSRETKTQELKSVQIRVKTSDHDLETKAKYVERFIQKGHPVRVHIYLRGREKAHQDLAKKRLEEFLARHITFPHKQLDSVKQVPTGFSTTLTPE